MTIKTYGKYIDWRFEETAATEKMTNTLVRIVTKEAR